MRATNLKHLFIIVATFITYQLVRSEQDGSSQRQYQLTTASNRLIVISTTSDLNRDSFSRFNESIQANGLKLELLRDHSKEISSYQNGISLSDPKGEMRRRFEMLREKVSRHRDEKDLVLLLVEESNSIINGNEQQILTRFNEFNKSNGTRLLFSADVNCWPDAKLAEKYPSKLSPGAIGHASQDFLDSRSLIGFAQDLWQFLELSKSFREKDNQILVIDKVNYDFQLYSTLVYLSKEHRHRLQIGIDHRSSLFENLDTNHVLASGNKTSLLSKVELEFTNPDASRATETEVQLRNLMFNTRPLVVHCSGPGAKIELNSLGNYLGKAWTPRLGCGRCNESKISLASIKSENLPVVLVAVFIEEPTPFMENFFLDLKDLDYPKVRMHLFIYNMVEYHTKHVNDFLSVEASKYASHEMVHATANTTSGRQDLSSEWRAREYAQLKCVHINCDYLLSLDSVARFELPESLRVLIETNRNIVAPLLSRPAKLWSNFWGAITRDGYYARSSDYVELVARQRVGVWNVPLLMNAYLIRGDFLRVHLNDRPALESTRENFSVQQNETIKEATSKLAHFDPKFPHIKPALIFARNLRKLNVFQFVANTHEFGHLIDATDYNISLKYPDFYQLELNKPDWEREYLHENYTDLFDERDEDESTYPNRIRLEEPCQDVYWFPLVSDKFANQLVEMMEQFGQWSSGKNHDPRIEGGYESVPTRDIHFRQVGLHDMWLYFLQQYITPIQLKEYIGYEHVARTDLAFVVRYHPSEQPSLRPHHDSSTYTLNIALNTPGVDYEGGGCRFVRYNCSVTESRKGWALIHPGRLTHYHEGLPVTNGTRYILVTFVDP